MNPKVVFFGEADYGKSTLIGYLFSHAYKIDMNKVERKLRDRLGNNYQNDIVYSSLINPDISSSQTTQTVETVSLDKAESIKEGISIIKDTDTETVIQSTAIIGDKVRIITKRHQKGIVQRLNSIVHHLKNIEIPYHGKNIRFMLVDTPGHASYLNEREIGISIGDIGVFCIAINEILRDDFEEMLFAFEDLWSQYNYNKKLIYALTKFDWCDYSEYDYKLACERIKKYCRRVSTDYDEDVFGGSMAFSVEEEDAAAIVPVAIDFDNHDGINIVEVSDKCPWYKGPSLLEAIVDRMSELAAVYEEYVPKNLLFSVDKEIDSTRNKAGKVWRIHIKNGKLNVGDKVVLTSAAVAGYSKDELYDVTAEIKSIHNELDAVEGVKTSDTALSGEVITVDLKNCAVGGKRINKSDIRTSKTSVGYSAGEQYGKYDEFDIEIAGGQGGENIRNGQNIVLLWQGRRVSAKVTGKTERPCRLHIKLLYGKSLDIPTSENFLTIEDFKSFKFFSEAEGKLWYYSGAVRLPE